VLRKGKEKNVIGKKDRFRVVTALEPDHISRRSNMGGGNG